MESEFDINQIRLPKWPALVVKGKKISREQAAEVIIRTDGLDILTNDRESEKFLLNLIYEINGPASSIEKYFQNKLGIGFVESIRAVRDFKEKTFGDLGLYYLRNQRIVSTNCIGPHGWCNWAGIIYSNTYNIGKNPTAQEVLSEWIKIAETFPFLDLECQLMSGEVSENFIHPIIEFRVKNGKAKAFRPEGLLDQPRFPEELVHKRLAERSMGRKDNQIGEMGCKREYLIETIDYVRRKIEVEEGIRSNQIWQKLDSFNHHKNQKHGKSN